MSPNEGLPSTRALVLKFKRILELAVSVVGIMDFDAGEEELLG